LVGTYLIKSLGLSYLIESCPSCDHIGTWKSKPGAVEIAVSHALKHGYKSIDTAAGYANETEVGKGIKDSGVPREQIFLTTKLDNCDHKDVEGALNKSLKNLGTDYLDLCMCLSACISF
jgi:glycerol 2-dehydrogenase (NADP+)